MDQRRTSRPMRLPFSITVAAMGSGFAQLKNGIHTHRICLFCDLPWICFAALAYLAKSCLFHRYHRRATFLDRNYGAVCNCPHCVHTRSPKRAA